MVHVDRTRPLLPSAVSFTRSSSHSLRLLSFHYDAADGCDGLHSDAEDDIEQSPTFHDDCEDDSDDSRAVSVQSAHLDDCTHKRAALTVTTYEALASPATFFASSSFASVLSARAASLHLATPTHCSSRSSSASSSSSQSPSSELPCYSPHSSCVKPSVFAWQLEEAAVLFWERKNVLAAAGADAQVAADSSENEPTRPARFAQHSRHASL